MTKTTRLMKLLLIAESLNSFARWRRRLQRSLEGRSAAEAEAAAAAMPTAAQ
jgi:hypothetical protein